MKRGEIYYITRRDTIGTEIKKSRPGVIVSTDELNHSSGVVEVVYLTAKPKKEMGTHATIHATGVTSTVLCEQIDTVSTDLVGAYCGTCTAEEMERIDYALLASLGLGYFKYSGAHMKQTADEQDLLNELERLREERDRYAKMVDYFLGGDT